MYSKVDHGITVGGKGCILVVEKSKYVQFPNRPQSLCTMHASGTCRKPFFSEMHISTLNIGQCFMQKLKIYL